MTLNGDADPSETKGHPAYDSEVPSPTLPLGKHVSRCPVAAGGNVLTVSTGLAGKGLTASAQLRSDPQVAVDPPSRSWQPHKDVMRQTRPTGSAHPP